MGLCGWESYLWCAECFAVYAVSRHTHAAIPTRIRRNLL